MSSHPSWYYDEMKQVGKDFSDPAEVEAYDARHGRFRNVDKENDAILAMLGVGQEDVLMDIGTGTGAFALRAAGKCAKVFAVDISRPMLDYAKQKAARSGIANITFCHGGFLSYIHEAPPVDAVVTSTALHHLPDFWKGVALRRLNGMVKPGGQLFLSDIVFEHRGLRENIDRFSGWLEKTAGPAMREDIESHIRSEFSTYDWIMEGLLERSGFRIMDKKMHEGVIGRYLCRKEAECAPW